MSSFSSSSAGTLEGRSALVVGADGMIGSAVARELESVGVIVTRTTRRADRVGIHWDLAWVDIPRELLRLDFDVVVIAAAVTTLEACASDPLLSRTVNVDRPADICRRWGGANTRVIGLSTSLVFDGETPFPEPADDLLPTSEYGRQKASMERTMLDEGSNVAILRMTKVVSPDWPRLTEWRSRLSSGSTIAAFVDTGFSPVSVSDVASSIVTLCSREGSEILHLSARDEISYFDLAEMIKSTDGSAGRVVPAVAGGSGAFRRFATLGTASQALALPGTDCAASVVVRALLQ